MKRPAILKLLFGASWAALVVAAHLLSNVFDRSAQYPYVGWLMASVQKGYWWLLITGVTSLCVREGKATISALAAIGFIILAYITAVELEVINLGSDHNLLGIELFALLVFCLPWVIPALVIDCIIACRKIGIFKNKIEQSAGQERAKPVRQR